MKYSCYFILMFCNLCLFSQSKSGSDSTQSKSKPLIELGVSLFGGAASNNSGYIDVGQFSYSNLTTPFGKTDTVNYNLGAGIGASFEASFLFGRKQNIGIGAAINYTASFTSLEVTNFSFAYSTKDAEQRTFTRIVTARKWKESLAYSHLSIPVMFKFRAILTSNKRTGLFFDAGPLISVYSNATSKGNGSLDFEAIYGLANGQVSPDNLSTDGVWVITRKMAAQHISDGGQYSSVEDYFSKQYQRGYPVALNQQLTLAKRSIAYKIGFGGIIRFGMIHRINRTLSLTLGGQVMIVSASQTNRTSSNTIAIGDNFQETTGASILPLTSSTLHASYGIHLGIQLRIAQ